ncbi:MAG: TonB-dependent receptor [Rhodothermaceae bacterium]|nr:TonB-dependent receptor [Rhodothermaceae bacterium]
MKHIHFIGRTPPIIRSSLFVLLLISLLHQGASAQIPVTGTVVSDDTGEPLAGVSVVIDGTFIGTITDQDGMYAIDLRTQDDVLVFSFVGFRTQRRTVGPGVTSINVRLQLDVVKMEEISVVGEELKIFASNVVAAPMIRQQSSVTSVASIIDNLPGVSVQEGDSYGMEDWSSNVAMRGFQVTINESQIGTTIDGFSNGTSDYWSGAKANRFVDVINLGGIEVSQGTADIASQSVEALGGTFNYITDDPALERRYKISAAVGEHDARRIAMRIDTGPLFGEGAHAWITALRQEATDWVQGSAQNEREHFAAKLASAHWHFNLTRYFSYDRINEENYQRIYSEADFRANPRWDRLIGDWPGVPYLNQFYRRGWKTVRSNTFGYVKADWDTGLALSITTGAYFHRNRGRGDWMPPYIVDVTDDQGGPESELQGGPPIRGGQQLGLIRFVDRSGSAVLPEPGCTSSYIFNYYGAGGPEVDPACHPGATAVQSYRHSHYGKDRTGVTAEGTWTALIGAAGSSLRTGIWYERSRRLLGRDWHRMLDPSVSQLWDERPYWHQYEWEFPQHVFRWYLEETLYVGSLTASVGARQFLVGLTRTDDFNVDPELAVDSNSDLLFSGGVTYESPIEGLRLFAGYSENFRAFSSALLEVPGRSLDALEPETSSNIDLGVQYSGGRVALSGTWYSVDFENRIVFLGPQTVAGPNYLIPGGGAYFNAGGLDTRGFEFSATVQLPRQVSLYSSYTRNNSEYIGSGNSVVDADQGTLPGTDVTGVPDQLWVVSVDRPGPLSAGLSAKYTATRRVSLTTDWYADAYWIVDAYVSLLGETLGQLFRSMEFSLVANNLFDEAYLSAITENAAWLGAPRTISMTTTITF